ncbi:MAG: hypothetical protein NVSMB2_01300 [Chloroflexota bacterium]
MRLLPLFSGDGDRTVLISSDTWPGAHGVLGRTPSDIEEAKATGLEPTRSGGFAYMRGPDNAIVEYAGNYPALGDTRAVMIAGPSNEAIELVERLDSSAEA